jgi:hypothetical protein
MNEEPKIDREFYVIEDKHVFDYFVEGFESKLGKIIKYQHYYDPSKKTVVFELFVNKH